MLNKLILLSVLLGLLSCGGGSGSASASGNNVSTNNNSGTANIQPVADEEPVISRFSFLAANNPGLESDIELTIDGQNISGRVTSNSAVDSLIATVEHGGSTLFVSGMAQTTGTTENDFTDQVSYTVATDDGRDSVYTVDVMKFTGLPIIYLQTDGNVAVESKDDYVPGTIVVDGGRDFEGLEESTMKIRGRGNSTWFLHPKKPFQMKLSDKTEFLGMPEDKKWLFLAEYSDKTMLRNTIVFEMGHLSSLNWTPKHQFAEVYLNQEYNGTYNITQKVEEDGDRVDIGDDGFLLEIDQLERLDPDDVYFNTEQFLINIKSPDLNWDDSQYVYIKELINDFETSLYSNNFANPDSGYIQHIDIESFIDWYLINEIVKNQDSQSFSSIFLHVIPGEKIKMGPLWDFDLAFGNVDYSDSRYAEGYWVKDHPWYQRLFDDPAFVAQVKSRFAFYRANQDLILEKIDSYAEQLTYAQQENNNKWQTLGIYVWPNPVFFDTYEEEVAHLKSWYNQRMDWLEEAYESL